MWREIMAKSLPTEETDYYEENVEVLAKAMLEAKKRFDEYFEENGLDGAFWDLKLEGIVLTQDFEPWKRITMDFNLNDKK